MESRPLSRAVLELTMELECSRMCWRARDGAEVLRLGGGGVKGRR